MSFSAPPVSSSKPVSRGDGVPGVFTELRKEGPDVFRVECRIVSRLRRMFLVDDLGLPLFVAHESNCDDGAGEEALRGDARDWGLACEVR